VLFILTSIKDKIKHVLNYNLITALLFKGKIIFHELVFTEVPPKEVRVPQDEKG
jgi:hypothetical protein